MTMPKALEGSIATVDVRCEEKGWLVMCEKEEGRNHGVVETGENI